jgi:16S rRNA (cytidine1402-2'-O)-methyltransferase
VLYESPFRVGKLLTDIASIDPNRLVCIGRELTKIHEEIIEGTARRARRALSRWVGEGEFCLIVRGLANEPSSGQAGDDL